MGEEKKFEKIVSFDKSLSELKRNLKTIEKGILENIEQNHKDYNKSIESLEASLHNLGEDIATNKAQLEDLKSVLNQIIGAIMEISNNEYVIKNLRLLLRHLNKGAGGNPKNKCTMMLSDLSEQEADTYCNSYLNECGNCYGCKYYKQEPTTDAPAESRDKAYIIPEEDIQILMNRIEEYLSPDNYDSIKRIITQHSIFFNFEEKLKEELIAEFIRLLQRYPVEDVIKHYEQRLEEVK